MSAVPITIVGIETRSDGSSENVTIVGMASLTGLGVGGGPIVPPGGGGGPPVYPAHPIVIPPGSEPHPEHPIVIPPPRPPDLGIWPNPPEGIAPHPEHPIVIPQPPTEPPTNPSEPKPPPPEGGWGWHPVYGWGYFPGTGGKPQPPGETTPPA